MTGDEICTLPATRLAALIASRRLSPVEVTEAVLARAERLQPVLNVFAESMADSARSAAKAAEIAVMGGLPLGPLHGVPITVKDNVAVAGVPLRNGSLAAPPVMPAADPAVVARVKAAGAIIIGKTTLPEFAHKVLTDSKANGVTRNPWNLAHTPGGSSGGASAALAAGIAPLAIGTDGGGSIRCPSSCAGLVGLKATLGRIANEAMPDGFGNFAFVGPMARRAEDTALLFSVMRGPHPNDPYSIGAPPPDRPAPLAGLRIGWIEHFGPYRTEAETAALTGAAVATLANRGALVEPVSDPCFDDVFPSYRILSSSGQASRLGRFDGEAMTESMRECIAYGRRWSAVEWVAAHDHRTRLFRSVQALFERFDVLATPTMTAPPPTVDAGGSVASEMYAAWAATLYPFNLTGHPAASVPAGFTATGLPVGLQLIGPWFGEERILGLAATLEEALGLADRWPDLPGT
ncbi:amidase [Roseomonas sp. OT10]|uniref:amidase n=1 Tax=Roseomonas cutis TaxID=2897332 RepID=UPI001E411413|nr:amidase family protein [Roseomonas sp. OT10]UFN47564.1 amidase [Roseomonas sp. OT10]